MAHKVTIKDVAQAAGVALGTASRVINRASNVAPKIRKRVEAAIEQLSYQPDVLAQSMRKGSTRTIGIIIRDITLPAFASFVRAAQEELEGLGYAILITCSGDRRDRELELLKLLSSRRVDGLIMTSCSESDKELLSARASFGAPVVMLDRTPDGDIDSLVMAHSEGMRQATEYLLGLGHGRVALITGSREVHSARDRIDGFVTAHNDAGVAVDDSLIRAKNFGGEYGFIETSALLGADNAPTAIIAGGIAMLPDILRAIRARGLSIPDDISIIGGGDSDLAMLATPPITVVRWDYAEVGRAAALRLSERLATSTAMQPQKLVFPTEFVVRASCGPPSV